MSIPLRSELPPSVPEPPPLSIPPPPPPEYLPSSSTNMGAGSSGLWKTLLIPLLLALIFYLLIINIFLPLYRRLPPSRAFSTSNFSKFLPASLRNRLSGLQLRDLAHFSRRRSLSGEESLLGDEELEEGFLDSAEGGRNGGEDGERRLSRELEVGFRDESDDEDDDGDRRGRR